MSTETLFFEYLHHPEFALNGILFSAWREVVQWQMDR